MGCLVSKVAVGPAVELVKTPFTERRFLGFGAMNSFIGKRWGCYSVLAKFVPGSWAVDFEICWTKVMKDALESYDTTAQFTWSEAGAVKGTVRANTWEGCYDWSGGFFKIISAKRTHIILHPAVAMPDNFYMVSRFEGDSMRDDGRVWGNYNAIATFDARARLVKLTLAFTKVHPGAVNSYQKLFTLAWTPCTGELVGTDSCTWRGRFDGRDFDLVNGTGDTIRLLPEVEGLPPVEMPESYGLVPSYFLSSGGVLETAVGSFDALPELVQALQQMCDETLARGRTRDMKRPIAASIQLVRVQRIENTQLWQDYRQRCWKMHRRRSAECLVPVVDAKTLPSCEGLARLDKGLQELYLFHGTSKEAAWNIAQTNFDLARAGLGAGAMFGKALYFAESIGKADEYTTDDEEGLCHALLCRVACGKMLHLQARGDLKNTFADPRVASGEYDSILGDREAAVGTYREFVIFEKEQVYPEYVFSYSAMRPPVTG